MASNARIACHQTLSRRIDVKKFHFANLAFMLSCISSSAAYATVSRSLWIFGAEFFPCSPAACSTQLSAFPTSSSVGSFWPSAARQYSRSAQSTVPADCHSRGRSNSCASNACRCSVVRTIAGSDAGTHAASSHARCSAIDRRRRCSALDAAAVSGRC